MHTTFCPQRHNGRPSNSIQVGIVRVHAQRHQYPFKRPTLCMKDNQGPKLVKIDLFNVERYLAEGRLTEVLMLVAPRNQRQEQYTKNQRVERPLSVVSIERVFFYFFVFFHTLTALSAWPTPSKGALANSSTLDKVTWRRTF